MENKISFVIPVYNCENELERCLNSITKQYNRNLEIICVDDKSTDNSPQTLKRYSENYSFITVISNEINKGQGYSRNIGVELAQNNILCFVDADDYISDNYVDVVIDSFNANDIDEVFFSMCKVNKDEKNNVYYNISGILDYKFSFKIVSPCTRAIKKENFIPFPTTYKYEDYVARLKLLENIDKNYRVLYLNEQLYFYNIGNTNSTMKTINHHDFKMAVDDILSINTNLKNKTIILETFIDRMVLYGFFNRDLQLFWLFFKAILSINVICWFTFLFNRIGFFYKDEKNQKTLST